MLSVLHYGDSLVGECSRWLWAQVQILFTISYIKTHFSGSARDG